MTAPIDRHPLARAAVFARPLVADDVPEGGLETTIEANAQERAAIAVELELPAVVSLVVRYRLTRRSGGRLDLEGDLAARVTQTCVVSLEAFDSDVAQPIELSFAPAPQPASETANPRGRHERRRPPIETREPPMPTNGEVDPPDPIIDGRIDLGAVAVEFLALALDFYPKKPGVHFTDVVIGETDEPKPSAFAALERLKDRS